MDAHIRTVNECIGELFSFVATSFLSFWLWNKQTKIGVELYSSTEFSFSFSVVLHIHVISSANEKPVNMSTSFWCCCFWCYKTSLVLFTPCSRRYFTVIDLGSVYWRKIWLTFPPVRMPRFLLHFWMISLLITEFLIESPYPLRIWKLLCHISGFHGFCRVQLSF